MAALFAAPCSDGMLEESEENDYREISIFKDLIFSYKICVYCPELLLYPKFFKQSLKELLCLTIYSNSSFE